MLENNLDRAFLEVLPLTVQFEDSLTKAASRNDDKDWLVDLSNLSSQGRLLLRTPQARSFRQDLSLPMTT